MIPKLFAHDERSLTVVLDEALLLSPSDRAAFRTDAALGHAVETDEPGTQSPGREAPPLAA